MKKSIHNTGILSLNAEDWDNRDPKTIVVMGVSRSGTSMIVSLLEGLGVNMGEDKSFGSQEDASIFNILEAKEFSAEKFKDIISERNRENINWGWKRPESYKFINRFENVIRNPVFIFTFRDILAISQRNNSVTGIDPIKALKANQERYKNILSIISKTQIPCLLISYEKAISDKTFMALKVAEFLGIHIPTDELPSVLDSMNKQKSQYNKSLNHITQNKK